MGELEAKFQLENKKAEISRLALSNTNKELCFSQQRVNTYGIVGFVLIIGGITFLLIQQKSIQTRYHQTHLEQLLLQYQLHPHFIFNSMNSIYNQFLKAPEKAKPYLLGFSNLLLIVLEN
ncbi:MAG: histidine kinase [Bacteroidota bacterium]